MKEVAMLRRENAPHLNFLKKQVENLKKAKKCRWNCWLYREYLKRKCLFRKEKSACWRKKKTVRELEDVLSKISSTEEGILQQGIRK